MKLKSKSVIFLFLSHAQLAMFRNRVSKQSQGVDMERELGKGIRKVREGRGCDGAYNLLTVSLLPFCCCKKTQDKATKSITVRVRRMAACRRQMLGQALGRVT